MRRPLRWLSFLALVVGLLAYARPPSEWSLLTQLNAEPTRLFVQDGGLAYLPGGAVSCLEYSSAGVRQGDVLLLYTTDGGDNVCFEVQDGGQQGFTPTLPDGGPVLDAGSGTTCSTNPLDINFGVPMGANTFLSVVTGDSHRTVLPKICHTGGSDVVIWRMR